MTKRTREPTVYVGIDVSRTAWTLADKKQPARRLSTTSKARQSLLEPRGHHIGRGLLEATWRPGKALHTRFVPGGHDRGGGQSQAGA